MNKRIITKLAMMKECWQSQKILEFFIIYYSKLKIQREYLRWVPLQDIPLYGLQKQSDMTPRLLPLNRIPKRSKWQQEISKEREFKKKSKLGKELQKEF